MNRKVLKDIHLSIIRRSRDVRQMRVMTCLAVFFLVFMMLLQDNIGLIRQELNYANFGQWVLRAENEELNDALISLGVSLGEKVYVGSSIYLSTPKIGWDDDIVQSDDESDHPSGSNDDLIRVTDNGAARQTFLLLGAFPEGFAEKNNIVLYEGRFPEKDNEITAEYSVLQKLGYSYELGQKISFYIADHGQDESETAENSTGESNEILSLRRVEFILVGTIKRYTEKWDRASYEMPNAIITKESLDKLGGENQTFSFYYLKDVVTTGNVTSIAEGIFAQAAENVEGFGDTCVSNYATYLNPMWESRTAYRSITILLVLLSVCILTYLMATYIGKRKKHFIMMRELGASVFDVKLIQVYECLISVALIAVITFIVSFALSFVAALIISKANAIKLCFEFNARTILVMIGVILVSLLVSAAFSVLIIGNRRISATKKRLVSITHLRKRAKKRTHMNKAYCGLSETLIRERNTRPFRTAAIRFVSIMVCAVIIICAVQTGVRFKWWQELKNNKVDVEGSYAPNDKYEITCTVDTEPHWVRTGTMRQVTTDKLTFSSAAGRFYSTASVISEKTIKELLDVPGIREAWFDTFDCTHNLVWEDQEQDPYLNYCIDLAIHKPGLSQMYKLTYDGPHLDSFKESMSKTFYRLFCYTDPEEYWKAAEPYMDASVADYEAFLLGEQVIIVVDTEASLLKDAFHSEAQEAEDAEDDQVESSEPFIFDQYNDPWNELGHTLDAGDTVFIQGKNGNSSTETDAVVAAVVPLSALRLRVGDLEYPQRLEDLINVVGSSKLAQRVMEADGDEYGANVIRIGLNSVGKNENASKVLASILSKNGVTSYSDMQEFTLEAKENFIQNFLTYGLFGLSVIVLYLFIMTVFSNEEQSRLLPHCIELKNLGESIGRMQNQASSDAAIQSLWILLALPISLIISVVISLQKLWPGFTYNDEIKANMLRHLRDPLGYFKLLLSSGQYSISIAFVITVLFMLIYWTIKRRLPKISVFEERSK